ncbi:SDR family NAD(P)-dependent oxidoreductase [Myroides sp. LJL119]
MKTILITGATSGIGKATAKLLAPSCRLILCGRKSTKLQEIQMELSAITQVKTLCFDVSDKQEVFKQIAQLDPTWQNIDVLVNNAGNAHGLASFQQAELQDLEDMIDINVKGLIYVTKAVLPYILKSENGHIINISSTAGKQTYGNAAVYCASKAAVEALSQGLRIDLLNQGVKVTNIAPGAVHTDFSLVRFKGDQQKAEQVYQGFDPLLAIDIAKAIEYAIEQPKHVQIADMTILPKAQANSFLIQKNNL